MKNTIKWLMTFHSSICSLRIQATDQENAISTMQIVTPTPKERLIDVFFFL